MKWLVFCVVAATLVKLDRAEPTFRTSRAASVDAQCEPSTSWSTGCLACDCDALGYAHCKKNSPECKEEVSYCKPGSQFRRGCATCACQEDARRALCSLETCSDNAETPDSISASIDRVDSPVEDIVPLHGNEGAQITEVKNAKPAEDSQEHEYNNVLNYISRRRRSVCKPNQEFQNDCNICTCAADGLSYRCTQNECMDKDEGGVNKEVEVFMESEGVDHIERHSVCAPHAEFFAGCSQCRCNALGTDYSCGQRDDCTLPPDVELFHEFTALKSASPGNNTKIVCVANRMFIKDCNTCWCNEDGTGYICTRKVCISELPDDTADDDAAEQVQIVKKCRPNEVFEMDCNMCVCNADGKGFSCTRRACAQDPPIIEDVQESYKFRAEVVPEPSNPGSLIDFLTRHKRGSPQEQPKKCQPAQEFRIDCNKCLCYNDGLSFSCTRNDCRNLPIDMVKPDTSVRKKRSADSDPNFRCNPGEQFKRGCNDCTCSADGKSVFCSLLPCEKDGLPKI